MNLIHLAEKGLLPDWLVRLGIRRLLRSRLCEEKRAGMPSPAFLEQLRSGPVAIATGEANSQHYEVPPEFFQSVLGPRLKYSCCLFDSARASLAEAEEAMLALTCQRAELADGMDVLELGCGWGSLSLWIARHYPRCTVTAVSNSHRQRRFIESRCREQGLTNVRVQTADMRNFEADRSFDRIVSIEMFEHMRNYEVLLHRIAHWLRPGGKLFAHIFCHRELAYPFSDGGDSDWMARHFFTGGIMPSFDLLRRFDKDMHVTHAWPVNGLHYARTCEAWLSNLDDHRKVLLRLFEKDHRRTEAAMILQRWRMFFMACAELFRHNDGGEWFVGHYLMEPQPVRSQPPYSNHSLAQGAAS